MTTICITIAICVALICATRIYPLWLEYDRKRIDKAKKIINEVREENNRLRKDLKDNIDYYLDEYNKQDKTITDIMNKLYELTERIEKKL